MRGIGLLLLLLLATSSRAEGAFDTGLARTVYAAALAFIEPRALDPVSVPELTIWGLRGLTALDPALTVRSDGSIRLLVPGQPPVVAPVPDSMAPDAWARLAAALSEAGWAASPGVRRAGTEGVMRAFFGAMLPHLDPYSRYIPPDEAAVQEEQRVGAAGVGLVLSEDSGGIFVAHAIRDGPAAQAGVRDGDRLLAINGQATFGAAPAEVSAWLAGPEGSEVTLEVQGSRGTRRLFLTRAETPEENVFASRTDAALVVRVANFTDRTAARLASVLEVTLERHVPPPGIVLDLRGNRGGLVRQAVAAAGVLLPQGVVAVTQGRDPMANRVWSSSGNQIGTGRKLVVLVDEQTASAAEILAASLADRGRAVVVGSVTMGKGLVQTVTRLPDGGELALSWSRVLAPRGWPIEGLGVLPQVCTSLGEPSVQRQLGALASDVQPMASALARARGARVPVPPAEIAAIRGTCPPASGTKLDLRVALRLINEPSAYSAALLPGDRVP
ncbi:MAG TPA: S41 family peptidase [Acetobacteraceae bacterium]|nr:S41 family peptidase [Acetobacteraceae bacterium]